MNPIAELRAISPSRPLAPWEARVLAEKQANRLLRLQWVSDPAVPEQLIEYLPRVRVRYVPAPRTFAGSSKWDGQRWMILVNRNDSWGRQRFTMAHELKHVIDHTRQTIYANPRFGSAYLQAERAADYFAACLLMPKAWVKRAFYDEGIRDPRVLARRFEVSTASMRVRLDQLRLFEPAKVAA